MRIKQIITLTALVAAGSLGAAAPTVSAHSRPAPLPPFIECAGGETDIGDGRGSYYCVPSNNIHCPGTWTDNGNGTLDYGECLVGGGGGGGGGDTTQPPATQPPATQPPPTQPPATQPPATQPSATQPPATDPPGTSPSNPNPEPEATEVERPLADPSIAISTAYVACDGTVHVEFDTDANPAPADEVTQLILIQPASDPSAFTVVERAGESVFGSFTYEQIGSVDNSYRVFITVLFDPDDPDSLTLTDWANVVLHPDC